MRGCGGAGCAMGRDPGGVCGDQAGPETFRAGAVRVSARAHREIQNAARGGVRGRGAAEDRNWKNCEARAAREVLGGQRAAGAEMRAAAVVVCGMFLGVCGAQAQIDPALARVIEQTKAIDNHAHPLRYDAPGTPRDEDYDALPCDNLEQAPGPVRSRADNPELIAGWRLLYGYAHNDMTPAHV